jgi:hypothetical protein
MPKYRSKRKFKRGRKKYVPKKQKFGNLKSLNYKGFHCFKEKASGVLTITGSAGAPNSQIVQNIAINGENYSTWRFNLNQINDIQNYKNLFQQGRLTGVQIKFYPPHTMSSYTTSSKILDAAGNPAGSSTSTVNPIPTLVYKFDPNDTAVPTSFENLLERDPRFIYLNRPKSLFLKPKLLMVTAEGSTLPPTPSIFVNSKTTKWLNMNSLDVAPSVIYDYCGLDMGSMNCQGSVDIPMVITYYFQCKHQT